MYDLARYQDIASALTIILNKAKKLKRDCLKMLLAHSFHLDCHSVWCFFYNTFITEPVFKIKVNT